MNFDYLFERFKVAGSEVLQETVEVIGKKDFKVRIFRSDEMDKGAWKWVICDTNSEHWLETFDEQQEAMNFCDLMHWRNND
ncbi:hypothetical protein [Candidatus Venteria ishoeyi]|uniref:hypothetical protein n=1 Tax=Candidatus Venteria ishoeyi TaxID=1899563 RepID=UPI0011B0BA1D|nr:hypothetical protein [Candidatus Venteria ishoeyi]